MLLGAPRFTRLLIAILLPGMLAGASFCAAAQEMRGLAVAGYVTSLQLPAGFDVNGDHVLLTAATGYGVERDKSTRADTPLKEKLQVGAYVYVLGAFNHRTKTATARAVLFREDWNSTLSGIAVIDKILSNEPDPVYRADGYFIRVSALTDQTFKGSINSLSDVGTNSWIAFEGKRDADGILAAAKVAFLPPKPTKFNAVQGLEISTVQVKPAGATGNDSTQSAMGTIKTSGDGASLTEDEKIKIGLFSRWHTLPADQPLQQRVQRIGRSLIPAYQRTMDDADPSKIHFRFFAADYKSPRAEICLLDGVILVPLQVIERIQNDDQLAAVLADGVAYNLQRQAAKMLSSYRKLVALDAGTIAASIALPPLGFAMWEGSVFGDAKGAFWNRPMTLMQEDRARVALALMKDDGYDPRQAPEAWRLLAPKTLPKDPATLRFPDISGYQLSILNLQYRATKGAELLPVDAEEKPLR